MKPDTTKYPTYNYPDIFSKYFFHNRRGADCICPEHTLVFVISGQLTVHCKCGTTTVNEGEYIFLRKDKDTVLERKPYDDKPFRSVFMGFNQCFLRKLHPLINRNKISSDSTDFTGNVITIPKQPYLESLYISLLPYLQYDASPMKQVLEIKLMEAVYSLILTDNRFYSCLFDFDKQENIECEIDPIPCDKPHQQSCYITKKMDSSYIMMQNNGHVTDVYLDVTYKNVARFLNAFGQGLIFPPLN